MILISSQHIRAPPTKLNFASSRVGKRANRAQARPLQDIIEVNKGCASEHYQL
jgi:hypothetical protein